MSYIIVILGPTATGKTEQSINIAQHLQSEIINADSRQIYTMMDIGTAKPSQHQLDEVPHHLVSIRRPDHNFNVNEYKELCKKAVTDIIGRDKIPIICGGSGQYIYSIIKNWTFGQVPPNKAFRAQMYQFVEDFGTTELHDKLKTLDPIKANSIDYRNIPRVIRALEIASHPPDPKFTNDTFFEDFKFITLGLTTDRSRLYHNIDIRVETMIKDGLLGEVQFLLDEGFPASTRAFNSPGYREIISHLQHQIGLEEALSKTKTRTHTLARKQYNWFKLDDPLINWFDSSDPDTSSNIIEFVDKILQS